MRRTWIAGLEERGWAELPRDAQCRAAPWVDDCLRALGATRIAGQVNVATDAGSARPNTLSSRHGRGAFPLHTDCAASDDPPRYVLLSSTVARPAATLVLDTRGRDGPLADGRNALFRVADGRRCHYARFREGRPSGALVRYNAATHLALNEAAAEIEASVAVSAREATRIDWTRTRAVVIDNWACLHGRERIDVAERGRMRRFLVWTRS
ncbi:hypothetical protein NF701_08970 [Sphingomonadaceae bacterium OTU29THOMA1]|nr:hypothetical protein NF701_08970 [Sphingomonadaceae bacterium OTU29THOMA1]